MRTNVLGFAAVLLLATSSAGCSSDESQRTVFGCDQVASLGTCVIYGPQSAGEVDYSRAYCEAYDGVFLAD